ncbi:hypothetical protein D1AOALGA4SA_2591 [Olavius algarvensis Delta 1 endosymbiont]|nr:hypothetical protein D1AOALGA4SA_2591 [Olavius algarvensis Delta 1 endosymbiont]
MIGRFTTCDKKLAEHETLFLFHEKQGLAKIIHFISRAEGIILKFNIKQIPQPLFASQACGHLILKKSKLTLKSFQAPRRRWS